MTNPNQREALLELIFTTSPDGIVIIDQHGVIQHFSGQAERLFGYTAHEAVGMNVKVLMPSPYREQHNDRIARYIATGERRVIGVGRIARGQRKDGSTFPIELAVGELNSEGARLFTGFVRDLSEHQEREQRLHELQSELIHVARLNDLGQMVSALAHEVNQPLTAIDNYLRAGQHFSDAGDIAKAKTSFGRAVEQAARAKEIIRGLRNFVEKKGASRRRENLSKVIEEAAALALVGLKDRGIAFAMCLHPDAVVACIDKIQIQQVLLNLLRNAIEAMADCDTRSILITSEPVEDGTVLIRVADSGSGLSPDVRARLFQPFVTTKSGGIGVGLSICRSIIEAHGGRISAEDNPGGGTVFKFTVPRPSPDQPQARVSDTIEATIEARGRIFVVDDDESVRDSIKMLLEVHGLEAESYESAEAFAQNYRKPVRGCVILDHHLPTMTGLDFLTSPARSKIAIPIILITGQGDGQIRQQAIRAGAAAYLEKPVEEELLLATITRLLEESG